MRAADGNLHQLSGATIRCVLSLEEDGAGEAALEQRNGAGQRRRLNTRHRRRTLEHALLELPAAFLGVALRAEIERQHREMPGIEPGIDLLCVLQTSEEQAGADERDERQRNLRRHQHVAQAEHAVRA